MPDFPAAIVAGDPGHISHHVLLATLFSLTNTQGTLAARPAAGTARRTYWATDTQQYFRDDGSVWREIGTVSGLSSTYVALAGTQTVTGDKTFNGALNAGNKTSTSNVALRAITGDGRTWVSTMGNDAWDGLSPGTPKKTIAAALAAPTMSNGGVVYLSIGDFSHSATIDIPSFTTIQGGSGSDYNAAAGKGTRILYTGSNYAFRCNNVMYPSLRDLKVSTSNPALGVLELVDNGSNDYGMFQNLTFFGWTTAGSTNGIYAHGQVGCNCSHTFSGVNVAQFQTGVRGSGFFNANYFEQCWFGIVNQAVDLSATGGDTMGGSDNEFNRCEMNGGTVNGINLGAGANRNLFVKVVQDGVTTVGLVCGGFDNSFINCVFQVLGWSVTDPNAVFVNCTGTPAGYRNRMATLSLTDDLTLSDGADLVLGTGTGTQIGRAANQKLALWGKTPIVQPSGWTAATGTPTRTTFVTGTVTLPVLAEHVKALIDDLLAVGAIGP